MEFRSLFKLILDKKEKDNFRCEIIKQNIYRGKLYSKFIIFTELILSLTDIYLSYNSNRIDFKFNRYSIMYLIMIIVNIIYLFFLSKVKVTKINIKKSKYNNNKLYCFYDVLGCYYFFNGSETLWTSNGVYGKCNSLFCYLLYR